MAQLYRDQFYHYVNTATKTGEEANPTWVREGTGVESLTVEFNPQKDTYKDITRRTSQTTFNSYQLSSSVSGKRCYSDDPMYPYLKDLKDKAISAETQLLEVDTTANTGTAGEYNAIKYKILITITEWLGENATIGYDIDYSNPVAGTVTIAGGVPSFTPSTPASV